MSRLGELERRLAALEQHGMRADPLALPQVMPACYSVHSDEELAEMDDREVYEVVFKDSATEILRHRKTGDFVGRMVGGPDESELTPEQLIYL